MPGDPLWNSAKVRELVARRQPGGLVRLGREHREWTLAELGEHLGCSAATVSRMERRTRVTDLTLIQRAASAVGVPRHVLVSSLAPPAPSGLPSTRVSASPHAEEGPMRRRSLLAATATAPAAMLLGMDRALADTPPPTGRGALDARVASARDLYDKGAHTQLLGLLPGLLADGHAAASSRRELDQARLSSVYSLSAAR
ncbi:helix-turn-helix domain-containing protein [Streptomyces albidoflavus]